MHFEALSSPFTCAIMIPNHGRLSLQLDAFLNQLVPRSIIESLPPTSQALAPAFAPTAAPWNYLRKYTPRTQSWLSTRHQHRPPSLQISAYAQWYPFVCAALLSPSPLAFTSIHAHVSCAQLLPSHPMARLGDHYIRKETRPTTVEG
jgi:hypothetical protein